MQKKSLIVHISLALATIVAIAIATMVTSYWISDRADTHAHAINLAGSLRMQSYRLGMLTEQQINEEQPVEKALDSIHRTWQHPAFRNLRQNNQALENTYQQAYQHWQNIEPQLLGRSLNSQSKQAFLDRQVFLLENFVQAIQQHSEANGQLLRLVQVIALFLILGLAVVVSYWLKTKVEQPLSQLTRMAQRVAQGDYSNTVNLKQFNELGLLANSFNQMSQAISDMQNRMEQRIADQTQRIRHSNTLLEFLYDTAKTIIAQEPQGVDYHSIIRRLAKLTHIDDMELCLFSETGKTPFAQINTQPHQGSFCASRNCDSCLRGELITHPNRPGLTQPAYRYSFPLVRESKQYGVLGCYVSAGNSLESWQEQLIQSVADQLSLALSLEAQEDNARRLSLAQERGVIARELHDSIAQSLSYLKIQVTRLNRSLVEQDHKQLEEISQELQEGINSAYSQLRELLTTFRLKIEGPGLSSALGSSIKQLSGQSNMQVDLDCQINNIPFAPNEEVHLLQIVREAVQNALRHSRGNKIAVQLTQDNQGCIQVSVIDDGVGIASNPEKPNHFGLTSMQERSDNLGGQLSIVPLTAGGTGVYFSFTPQYLKNHNLLAQG